MQEHRDNIKIDPHNHNKCPLLHKEAKIAALSLGLGCRKCNILVITHAGTRALPV